MPPDPAIEPQTKPVTPPARRHPTSLRFTAAELELLDAWATYLGTKRARPVSRTEVIAQMLRRATEPEELGPDARAVRIAHQRAVMLDP